MEKKILYIAYNFPPQGGGGVLRSLKFVKYLPYFGWDPIVLTCKKPSYGIYDESLLEQIPENIKIERVYTLTPYNFFKILKKIGLSKLRQIIDYLFFIPDKLIGWIPFAYNRAVKLIKNEGIGVIITTSPPHSTHFIGILVKKKFPNVTFIADFRDAWCENPFRNVKRNSIRDKIESIMERYVIRYADRIIFNTHSSLNLHLKKYGDIIKSKSLYITNGYDSDDFVDIKKKRNDGKFIILHTGDIYGIRSIKPLINAIETLANNNLEILKKIIVKFVGYSISGIEKKQVDNSFVGKLFEFEKFVSHKDCLQMMVDADLLLLITGTDENKVMIPSKFYEYLGCGTSILAISEKGELTDILESCSAGEWAKSDDTTGIARILEKNIFAKTQITHDKNRIEQFSRKRLTQSLVEILNECIKNK